MGLWKITYRTERGYVGEVEVCAVNKFMAWDVFDEIAKKKKKKVVAADCVRILDEEEN